MRVAPQWTIPQTCSYAWGHWILGHLQWDENETSKEAQQRRSQKNKKEKAPEAMYLAKRYTFHYIIITMEEYNESDN